MAKKCVLIVDDDGSTRAMVRAVLLGEGFEVEEADGGRHAIDRLLQKRYDAVVLDMMMANGSGQDVLHTVAAQRPDVKCVVVISASSPATIESVEAANVEAKLRKPFNIQELVDAVRRCATT